MNLFSSSDMGGFPNAGVPVIVNPRTSMPFGLFHRVDSVAGGNGDTTFTLGAIPYQNGLAVTRIRSGVALLLRKTTDYTVNGVTFTLGSGATAGDIYVFDLWTATPNPGATTNPTPSDALFSSVSCLLQFEGTNGATTTTDVIAGNTWTFNANAKISTAWSLFGASSLLFDTGGGSLVSNNSANFGFAAGDYCVEAFINLAAQTGTRSLYEGRTSGTGVGFYSSIGGDSKLQVWNNSALIVASAAQTYAAGDHVALYRAAGNIYIAHNGVVVASAADSRTYVSSGVIYIGDNGGSAALQDGYIDSYRMTKGNGRYATAGFTPPSAVFPSH